MPSVDDRETRPRARRERVLAHLARDGEASVEALAEAFDVSPETVRRDLAALAGAGLVQKIHGGARYVAPGGSWLEGSLADRMGRNVEGKRAIAAKLARLLSPGDTVFLDTGSTTIFAAEALARSTDAPRPLTAVTNALAIAQTLGRVPDVAVYLLGGAYGADNVQTLGPFAIEQIGQFRADHAILTVAALDAGGASDASADEAGVARAMRGQAAATIVLADAEKLGRRAPFGVCALGGIATLVSDGPPPPALAGPLADAGVRVL